MDKVPKKLKPFFDASLKVKHRLVALQAFVEGSSEAEQAKVYHEYADHLVTFVVECYNGTLERLSTDRDYYAKFERALNREGDLAECFRVPWLLERVIRHLRGELPVMAQVDQLINIVRSLLHPGNHMTLRREGLRLLMFWLREAKSALPETVALFASVVPLRLFALDNPNVQIEQVPFPLAHEGEPPVFPSPPATGSREQALAMFGEMLDFITFDDDADRPSTMFLYGLLREHYLCQLYPVVCVRAGFIAADSPTELKRSGSGIDMMTSHRSPSGDMRSRSATGVGIDVTSTPSPCSRPRSGFVEACPPQLQAILMRYFAMWTVQLPELFEQRTGGGGSLPVATLLLQEIILGSPGDLLLVHEVMAQSLQLPAAYKPVVRMAFSVLRAWVFTAKERRPSFLTTEFSNAGGGDHGGDESNGTSLRAGVEALLATNAEITTELCGASFDGYLQKYMRLVSLVFHTKGAHGHVSEQAELYREGIYFLRGVAMKAFFPLSLDAWQTLLDTLLTLTENHLAAPVPLIMDAVKAEEFAQLLVETLFGTWIRSETMSQDNWERLARVLGACTQWQPVVNEWSKVILELTDLMARTVFNGVVTGHGDNTTAPPKKQLRGGTYEGGNLSSLLAMPSPLGRAMLMSMGSLGGNRGSIPMHSMASSVAPSPLSNMTTSAAPTPNPSSSLSAPLSAPALISSKSDSFLMWAEAPWTRDNVVFLWRNMLRALGDLNAIPVPDNHEMALSCLLTVLDRLFALREAQPYVWRPLPPLYEFATVLLDACDLPARPYERSRCLAYAAICRLFIRQPDMSFPDAHYPRFYLALVNGLSDKDDPVATVILLTASHLLGRQLPGSSILIPALLKCIAASLNGPIPWERTGILVPMMRIAAHVAILPDVTPGLTIPRIEAPLPIMSAIPITCAGEMELAAMRTQTRDFLQLIDGQEGVRGDAPVHAVLLSVNTVLLVNELLAVASASESLIDGYLNVLLDHVLPKDAPVHSVIFDQLFALAQVLPLDGITHQRFTVERQTLVIQRLVTGIRAVYSDVEMRATEQDELASRLILTLLEWLMALPHDWLSRQHSIRDQVFSVLEESLKRGSNSAGSAHIGGATQRSLAPSESTLDVSGSSAALSLAREAAEFTLVHLMHHLKNFSPVSGPAAIGCQQGESLNDRTLFFALDDAALLAVQHIEGAGGGPQVRLTVRNAAGRFAWDARIFFETFQHRGATEGSDNRGRSSLQWIEAPILTETIPRYCVPASAPAYERHFQSLPVYEEGAIDLERTDMLAELLGYLSEEHPDVCVNQQVRSHLTQPEPVPSSRQETVLAVAALCREQQAAEARTARHYLVSNEQHELCELPDPAEVVISYQGCRQFLASFGFFDPNAPLSGCSPHGGLTVLAKTPAMLRDLQGLDKLPSREVIKLAILYVAPGQEDEASILRNGPEAVSSAYQEFLRALGWSINLNGHAGYAGGLEPGMTVDDQALYWASSTLECIFHDATTLLYEEERDAARLIGKKRHIGNDHVHIVWNEHHREYRPSTMRTDYANAQIVISPADQLHLFRISLYREAAIGPFGPLFDGALVPRALLGPLVRATAVNAHRAVLASMGRAPGQAMASRARDLALVVRRHAQARWSMEQFLGYTLFANNPGPDEVGRPRPEVEVVTEQVDSLQVNA